MSILAHPAIGGFVSHCGWNSIQESLWFGVPIATWPLYGEQQTNAFEMVKELELSVEIKLDSKMSFNKDFVELDQVIVTAEEIVNSIRGLMDQNSEIRKKVKEMSEKCRKALLDGGSSHVSVHRLFTDVINY